MTEAREGVGVNMAHVRCDQGSPLSPPHDLSVCAWVCDVYVYM